MGIFDQIFGTSALNLHDSWKEITDLEELESVKQASFSKPVFIFKHSTRCGVSSTVLNRLIREWPFAEEEVTFYFLDLFKYRLISNVIAEILDVQHESPQVIMLLKGGVCYADSHYQITSERLKEEFEKQTSSTE